MKKFPNRFVHLQIIITFSHKIFPFFQSMFFVFFLPRRIRRTTPFFLVEIDSFDIGPGFSEKKKAKENVNFSKLMEFTISFLRDKILPTSVPTGTQSKNTVRLFAASVQLNQTYPSNWTNLPINSTSVKTLFSIRCRHFIFSSSN